MSKDRVDKVRFVMKWLFDNCWSNDVAEVINDLDSTVMVNAVDIIDREIGDKKVITKVHLDSAIDTIRRIKRKRKRGN